MSSLPHTISATVTALHETEATITLANGSSCVLPKHLISADATVGDSLTLAVFSQEDTQAEHERLAKAVLKELLN